MHVRCAPKADKYQVVSGCPLRAISGREQMQQGAILFDHLVGNREQRRRRLNAERLFGKDKSVAVR
jgi:hypothetical protein